MADPLPSFTPEDPIAHAASGWLARRDRGLTAAEQDGYLQWLAENPAHGAAIARLERAWGALDQLAQWRPAHSATPNPDLLVQPTPAPSRARRRLVPWSLLAVAAALAVFFTVRTDPAPHATPAGKAVTVRILPAAERLTLADGTVVELSADGRIESDFTAPERRVRLERGEALFTVAKNPARPFVVEARGITVRALGTVFGVKHGENSIDVLVTEGHVQVERAGDVPVPLQAGQKAAVAFGAIRTPEVEAVSAAEVERALAWRAVRLTFADAPLRDVVTEFNLRTQPPLVIGDRAAGELLVGGTFRADNVDAFVRLLEASFGVKVETRTDGTRVLRSH